MIPGGSRRFVRAILFPCPSCHHNNRVDKTVRGSLKLWLLDQLPCCKECGRKLRKDDYHHEGMLVEQARKELQREDKL